MNGIPLPQRIVLEMQRATVGMVESVIIPITVPLDPTTGRFTSCASKEIAEIAVTFLRSWAGYFSLEDEQGRRDDADQCVGEIRGHELGRDSV
jgi:hypothetical protein